MFILLLKVESELEKETFEQVLEILDNTFDIQGVMSFTSEGEEIETVANASETNDGITYEFDCENKVTIAEGDRVIKELENLIQGDFELDGPLDD
jgi:hypothetical protein